MTNAVNVAQLGSPGVSTAFKNRIINGAMVIDQRNAGASVTPASADYTLDRWQAVAGQPSKFSIQQNSGSVTAPVGVTNYLGMVSLSAYTAGASEFFGVRQQIEGFNTADLGWGTANAKTVTLSFWARSSLTGTFGGSIKNSAQDRSYPFSYSIPVANTWTQISIIIAGETTGTWIGATNGVGMRVVFSIGAGATVSGTAGAWASTNYNSATGATSVVGTSGATFYITGVQLEVGSTASSFDYRPYGTELALCQRYYFLAGGSIRLYADTIGAYCSTVPPVTPRATPTMTLPVAGTGSGILVVGANGTNGIYTLIKTSSGASLANADSYTMAGSAEL